MHNIILKYFMELPSSYVYQVYVKHKSILCSDLGPKVTHYVYVNIPKSEEIQILKAFWSQVIWIKDTKL